MSVLLAPTPQKMPNGSAITVNSDSSRQQPLKPALSFLQRLYGRFDGLFALPNRPHLSAHDLPLPPSRTWSEMSSQTRVSEKVLVPGQHMRSYIRDLSQSKPSQLGRTVTSDYISLPFRLSVNQAQNKMRRNVPYLRQGRCRIDLLAIIGFWVTFVLATTGIERGSQHVGVFRALSVLRTVRLLTITSGTTVSRSDPIRLTFPLITLVPDHHAFAKGCTTTSRQRCVFRAFRDGTFLVSMILHVNDPPSLTYLDREALLASRLSRDPSVAHATSMM